MNKLYALLCCVALTGCPNSDNHSKQVKAPIELTTDVEWERIKSPIGNGKIYRAPTPEGWVVYRWSEWDGSVQIEYVPDAKHEWLGSAK